MSNRRNIIKLRLTYFCLAFLVGIVLSIGAVGFREGGLCSFAYTVIWKLWLFSFLGVAVVRLVDEWFCDKKAGLNIAKVLRLWTDKDADTAGRFFAKEKVWEGGTSIEVALFLILAILTITTF